MTNKEAIQILRCSGYTSNPIEIDKAIELACKALEERPTGEWIKEESKSLEGMYRCSVCGRRVEDLTDDLRIHAGLEDSTIADIYPFCHCGADMRGEKNEIN